MMYFPCREGNNSNRTAHNNGSVQYTREIKGAEGLEIVLCLANGKGLPHREITQEKCYCILTGKKCSQFLEAGDENSESDI